MTIEKVKIEVEYEFDTETRLFRADSDHAWFTARMYYKNTQWAMGKYLADNPKLLPVPEKGRKIKATMRDGSHKTLPVNSLNGPYSGLKNTLIVSRPPGGYSYWMLTGPENEISKNEFEARYHIVAWEYVTEWAVVPGYVSGNHNALDPTGVVQASFNNKTDAEAFVAMKNEEVTK